MSISLRTSPAAASSGAGQGVAVDVMRDMAPLLVGLLPFAVVVGVAMADLGVGHATTLTVSFLLYGGSAQMAMVALIGSGSSAVLAALTALTVNARLLFYGASLATHFEDQPSWFRWLAPHFIVDQMWALATARAELANPARFRRYWLTAAGSLTIVWLAGVGAGTLLGPIVPSSSPLEVTTAALFTALVVPRLTDRITLLTALTATLVTVAASGLPNGLGLLAGIVAGVAAAIGMTRRKVVQ